MSERNSALGPTPTGTGPATAAKPLLTGPKRQHYLPKFYLDGFAKDGVVAVCDRETRDVRIQRPINTAVIGHFYTMEDEQGRKRFELEQALSWNEGRARSVIKKLSAKENITGDERNDLAIFIALAVTRTPDFVDSVKVANADMVRRFARLACADVVEVRSRLRRMPDAPVGEDELDAPARLIVETTQGGEFAVTTEHKWAIGTAVQVAMTLAPVLCGRNWVVSHRENEKTSFVTTDAPVCLTTVAPRAISWAGVGFGNVDALVLFPLNQSCMVAMFGNNGDLHHAAVDGNKMRRANLGFADRCLRFVIGRDTDLVRSLANHLGLANRKWRPKCKRHDVADPVSSTCNKPAPCGASFRKRVTV